MISIGIDAGKNGALAWMDGERKQIVVNDSPVLPDGNFDLFGMFKLLQDASWNGAAECLVTIEDTISIPHDARGERFLPASDKTLHVSLGAWRALCALLRLPVKLVHPRTWKRTMLAGIANDRAAEAKALKRRFQGHPICSQLSGPRGGLRDGRVDAVYLAEYGRLTWKLTGRC